MIPLKLSVRNFLCYRDNVPPLDLRGIHVACLCGANGHGKSALLDAMTWCLWGQARTGSQNYNALIAYGETECRVELDFLAGGQIYRAIRRRRSSGQGRTEVDLFVLDDGGEPRPITGNSVSETNRTILRLVGMDYATFVNTAFLRQGHADEFTSKAPSQRKEVLSSVLGLGLYDILQSESRGHRDNWRDSATRAEGAVERSQAALEALPDPVNDLADIAQRLTNLATHIAAATADASRHRATVEELRRKREGLDTTAQRIATLQKDLQQADLAADTLQQRINATRTLVERSDEIEDGAKQFASARAELNRLEAVRREYDRLSSHRNELQAATDREQARLSAEIGQLERRIRLELEPQADRSDEIARQTSGLAELERTLSGEQDELVRQEAAVGDVHREIALRQAELDRCVAEGKELRAKQNEMQSVDALCPLCRTPLSEDACGNITSWYESEIQDKLRLHRELNQTVSDLAAKHARLLSDTETGRKSLTRRQREIERDKARLEQEQKQSEYAARELQDVGPRVQALLKSLETGDFAHQERAELSGTNDEIRSLKYDEAVWETTYALVQSLQHWDPEERELRVALERLPLDESELAHNREQAARWSDELREAEAAAAADRAAIQGLPSLEKDLETAGAVVARLSAERDDLLARQGRLQRDEERRQEYLEELRTLRQSRSKAQTEQSIYADLFDAFGRGGVPAMLIDAAVPRIEAEANYLLGRMTDNRLAIKLETQRVRQGGNVAETLDIFVSDELGSRSYEMFSGGEAFRINLALRIALSKILAQRMGLPLPTLFIDEGFGTQDAAGRERIVDAISAIQNDFEKIIVITHLEELKDLFPVRIEVLKTDNGSQFWLS